MRICPSRLTSQKGTQVNPSPVRLLVWFPSLRTSGWWLPVAHGVIAGRKTTGEATASSRQDAASRLEYTENVLKEQDVRIQVCVVCSLLLFFYGERTG